MRLNTTAHHSPEYGSVQYVSERETPAPTYVPTWLLRPDVIVVEKSSFTIPRLNDTLWKWLT